MCSNCAATASEPVIPVARRTDALRVLMGVEAEYLEGAFAQIVSDHGSIDAYQATTFGVVEALKRRLRAQFSEG